MPTLLSGGHPPELRVKPGDVLLVVRESEEREPIGGEPIIYSHYALVLDGWSPGGHQKIYDLATGKIRYQRLWEDRVHFVPEDEWPDAVHALRAKALLMGMLDEES